MQKLHHKMILHKCVVFSGICKILSLFTLFLIKYLLEGSSCDYLTMNIITLICWMIINIVVMITIHYKMRPNSVPSIVTSYSLIGTANYTQYAFVMFTILYFGFDMFITCYNPKLHEIPLIIFIFPYSLILLMEFVFLQKIYEYKNIEFECDGKYV